MITPNSDLSSKLVNFIIFKFSPHSYMTTIFLINEAIIKSCLEFQPNHLKPYLLSDQLNVDVSDKKIFFNFFKCMIANTRKISTGDLHFKIIYPNSDDKNLMHYEFYDNVHLHPRLILEIRESHCFLFLEVFPF